MLSDWVTVHCPVCKHSLGEKQKGLIASFICATEGCSKTKHFFYPGKTRPDKSVPWAVYFDEKNKCGKPCCED